MAQNQHHRHGSSDGIHSLDKWQQGVVCACLGTVDMRSCAGARDRHVEILREREQKRSTFLARLPRRLPRA